MTTDDPNPDRLVALPNGDGGATHKVLRPGDTVSTSIPTAPPTETVEWWARRNARRSAAQVAAEFRAAADRIDRVATAFDHIGSPGRTTYAATAAEIFKEATHPIYAGALSQMIRYAGEADMYRAQRLMGSGE
jgi:hypothetical protein